MPNNFWTNQNLSILIKVLYVAEVEFYLLLKFN